jgi:hypothetical protein
VFSPTRAVGGLHRPIIPVYLEAPNGQWLVTDVLVDTGSDVPLFPESFAKALNLDLTGAPTVSLSSAIGSGGSYALADLHLELRRPPDVHRWKTRVGFLAQPMVYSVFGTRGFFEFFTVRYDWPSQEIEIVPAGPLPL